MSQGIHQGRLSGTMPGRHVNSTLPTHQQHISSTLAGGAASRSSSRPRRSASIPKTYVEAETDDDSDFAQGNVAVNTSSNLLLLRHGTYVGSLLVSVTNLTSKPAFNSTATLSSVSVSLILHEDCVTVALYRSLEKLHPRAQQH